MKIRVELYPAILLVVFMLLLSFPRAVLSQQKERLAVVSEYEGEVKVEHESILKTVKKIGNRIRNSAIYEEGSVMTMHASTADLVFNDNTSLQIDENTSLTICTREMSGEEEAEGGFIRKISGKQGVVVRNINIKAGKFLANITPSKSVLTEFETPTGVASVRGTMFTLAYVGGVTSIDLTEGLVEFASAGDDVSFSIEPGDFINVSAPELGHTSIGVQSGQLDVATDTGTLIVESGESAGVAVDADTGEVTVTAEEGMIGFEISMGNVMMAEGSVVGALLDTETGEVIMTAEVGMMEFETAMGNVMMDEGDAMGSHVDAETGEMFMTAEEGTIMFETSGGTVSLEKGEIVGTAFDHDTGEITMTAVQGEVSFDTPMGMAVMQEGAVVEVVFDDNTGEMSMSSGGGMYTLETDNGIITMEDGGSMDFTVDHITGEITVTGIEGDVVMTNEDGTITTIETGTSLGIMHDEGPMGSDDGYDGSMGPGPDEGPGPDGDHDEMGPEDFEGTYTETDEGGVYEGTMTDEYGTFEGTYTDSNGVFDGTYIDDTGTYIGAYNEADGSFTGTFVDAYTGGSFVGTFTDYGFTGTYTDASGNVYNFTDFQQSSFNANQNQNQDPGTPPTAWVVDNNTGKSINWSNRQNAFTTDFVGTIVTTTTPNPNTGPFEEHFGAGNGFAVIHTGFGGTQSDGLLEWEFNIGTGGENRQISFDYNFITSAENPANDMFEAKLIFADNSEYLLASATASLTISSGTLVSDFTGDQGSFGYQTGWLRYDSSGADGIDIPQGITRLRFSVTDNSNSLDSAVLLDNVVDPPVAASSTDYLLTFARMLRGDIGIHDADLEADAVASAEHQAFIDKVNEVISDMENSSDSDFVAGQNEFLDRLWVARDSLADHEDTTEFLQQTGIAHNLLEASIMTDEGVGTNITAIQDSLNQAKTFLVAHINDFGETDALANIRTNIDSVLANIDNVNNNEFTTATMVAIRQGIKQAFSDTIDNMSSAVCNDPTLPCYNMTM